jgi:hypothetical protein
MQYLDNVRRLNLDLTAEQHRACAFLEAQGQRFLVEFGYENAVERARQLWRDSAVRRRTQAALRRMARRDRW